MLTSDIERSMKPAMVLLSYIVLLFYLNVTLGEDCNINNVPEHIAWEKQLLKDLKCGYNAFYPPSGNITVTFKFTMKYFNFDSDEQVFTIQNWMFVSWKDERLKWNPEMYFGINATEISTLNLWTPGFRISNNADPFDFDTFYHDRCRLNSTGDILCVPWMTHRVLCSVKLTNWPYDVQECSLEYASWSLQTVNYKMNFSSPAISIVGAEYGAEWFISDYKQVENISGTQLKIILVLEREAVGLAAVMIYPAVILSALSLMCLFLDVRRQVRLSVSCFSLLSQYYFLSELGQNLPKESAFPPTILLYYRGSVILTVLIILFTFFLAAICKLRSTPHYYVKSVNDFVYESYGVYLVFPRWDFDDSKPFSEDWTKFGNVVNSTFVFIIIIAYISLYGSLMPKPGTVKY